MSERSVPGRPFSSWGYVAAAIAGLALPWATAAAADPVHTTAIGGLTLPEYIGPLEYMGERSGADPRRRATYSYRAAGLALDIEVRDLGPGGIPDGADSPLLTRSYEDAKRELTGAAHADRTKLTHERGVQLDAARSLGVREACFTKPHGIGTMYLWLTAIDGLLLDIRLDVKRGFEEDASISRGEILAALREALPTSPNAVARARAAAVAADSAMHVAILWDPATPEQEGRIWMTYLFARAAYAANQSEGVQPALGEREASFEEELRGRTMAVDAFREMKRHDAQLVSAYFSDIDRVAAAGFLREYVWSYLRRASWRAVPGGLDLRGFNDWRALHLPNHIAVTHGRIAFRLASQ
jgi:hypothetical protein